MLFTAKIKSRFFNSYVCRAIYGQTLYSCSLQPIYLFSLICIKSRVASDYAALKAGDCGFLWNETFENALEEIGFYLEKIDSSKKLKNDAPVMAPFPFEDCLYKYRYPSFIMEKEVNPSEWAE